MGRTPVFALTEKQTSRYEILRFAQNDLVYDDAVKTLDSGSVPGMTFIPTLAPFP